MPAMPSLARNSWRRVSRSCTDDEQPHGCAAPGCQARANACRVTTIEVLTQALQLAHGARHAALRHTGTLGALDAMAKAGLIPEQVCRELDHAYVFLRAAEHRRQLGLVGADVEAQVERSRARVREICASIGRMAD